jgi:hypothetical protein
MLVAASNYGTVRLTATAGTDNAEADFQIVFPGASPSVVRPANIIPGINYHSGDNTKGNIKLVGTAENIRVRGRGLHRLENPPEYLMKKDGEYFWMEVTGLTAGQEYAFQYLVDESVYVADPYADKILDPDDRFIPARRIQV